MSWRAIKWWTLVIAVIFGSGAGIGVNFAADIGPLGASLLGLGIFIFMLPYASLLLTLFSPMGQDYVNWSTGGPRKH